MAAGRTDRGSMELRVDNYFNYLMAIGRRQTFPDPFHLSAAATDKKSLPLLSPLVPVPLWSAFFSHLTPTVQTPANDKVLQWPVLGAALSGSR